MNNFDSEFTRTKKKIEFGHKPIFGGIIIVFVGIICWWSFIGYMVYKTSNKIQHDGLKSIINEVWEGQNGNKNN